MNVGCIIRVVNEQEQQTYGNNNSTYQWFCKIRYKVAKVLDNWRYRFQYDIIYTEDIFKELNCYKITINEHYPAGHETPV